MFKSFIGIKKPSPNFSFVNVAEAAPLREKVFNRSLVEPSLNKFKRAESKTRDIDEALTCAKTESKILDSEKNDVNSIGRGVYESVLVQDSAQFLSVND